MNREQSKQNKPGTVVVIVMCFFAKNVATILTIGFDCAVCVGRPVRSFKTFIEMH